MHKFPPSLPNARAAARKKNNCAPVTEFMRMNERLSGMLPNAARLMALQDACGQILPDYLAACQALQFDRNRLTIGAPSQAAAARLRQKLPFLKARLGEAGWPVDDIRIKVRLRQAILQPAPPEKKPLPPEAVGELEKLEAHLAESGTHPALMGAVHAMMKRHRGNPGK